jgi:hypothetical protein
VNRFDVNFEVMGEKEVAHANGNGHANGGPSLSRNPPAPPSQEEEQTDENIFLFVPNLIGTYENHGHGPFEAAC